MALIRLLDDALELAEILRPTWPSFDTGPLVCEGDDGDGNGDGSGDGDGDGDGSGADDGDDGDGDGDGGSEPDWKQMSRKHERAAKKARKELDELRSEIKELKQGQQTDQERAIATAKEEALKEAETKFEKERRADRLEVNVTRLSSRGFEIGEGDDAETVRFADPDDAIVHVERALDKGEIDADDLFDAEGKVQTDALKTALAELLERKPHLRADAAAGTGKPPADRDRGKGGGTKTDLEEMSPEDHERRKYGKK